MFCEYLSELRFGSWDNLHGVRRVAFGVFCFFLLLCVSGLYECIWVVFFGPVVVSFEISLNMLVPLIELEIRIWWEFVHIFSV